MRCSWEWSFRGRNSRSFATSYQGIASAEDLLDVARARADELAPLGANRKAYKAQKESMYGENAAINDVHGPAHLLRLPDEDHN